MGTIKPPHSRNLHNALNISVKDSINSQFSMDSSFFVDISFYLTYDTKNGSSKDSNQGKCFHPPHEPPWSTVVKCHGNDLLMVNFNVKSILKEFTMDLSHLTTWWTLLHIWTSCLQLCWHLNICWIFPWTLLASWILWLSQYLKVNSKQQM